MKTLDQSSIRKQNLRQLLALLSSTPAMTRHALAEATGLSLMTVTNLVDLLKAQGVLTFSPAQRQERVVGRKAENVSLCGTEHAWLVVDIASLHFTLLGFDMSLLAEGSMDATCCDVDTLIRFIHDMRPRVEQALDGRSLLGVALITSRPYEAESDTIRFPQLSPLSGVRIKELFRTHLGDYLYLAEQGVKYAVRSFSVLLGHSDCELLYYLYMGKGLGGALMHYGSLLFGYNNATGNVGLLTTSNGVSYDQMLSTGAFAAALGLSSSSDEALEECAAAQPELYRQTLMRFSQLTAEMLAAVVMLMDPNSVLIDCRYALPFEEEYLQNVRQALMQRLNDSARRLPSFSMVPTYTNTLLHGAVRALQLDWIEKILS
ncbi:MAG: ROK family transcriptional regulator [Clostridia bacterium]|nr:ROK family transcriptional regulator [Clostridia bacterium]